MCAFLHCIGAFLHLGERFHELRSRQDDGKKYLNLMNTDALREKSIWPPDLLLPHMLGLGNQMNENVRKRHN